MSENRRLAAIMFTDVVGYTGLTESDEGRALGVRDRHRALLRPLVEQFEGELVETPGDESLSVFPSAVRAVDCAFAIQAALRDDKDLKLRIGIHLGDVLRRDGEVIGEGVNLAARIRPLAEPGGVCVSEAVWRQVRGQPHLSANPLGPQRLKNVSDAMLVFALVAGGSAQPVARASRSGRRWALAGAGAAVAVLLALLLLNRATIGTTIALWAPKLFATPIDQELGMTTTSDGVRVAYAITGEGPPLLSVLGWATHLEDGLNSAVYDPGALLPMTSEQHRFVRYDGRGFGLSDRDVTDFSIDARVRDIEAVAAATGLERFAIYAQSAGGPAAIAFAARNPDRVSRLVLASTMAAGDYLQGDRRRAFERTLDVVEEDFAGQAATKFFVDVLFADPEIDEVTRRTFAEFIRRSANGPQLAGFMRAQIDIDVREEARQIRVPTLVIHGRDDATVALEAGRELAALIPNAQFEIVDGGHREGTGNSVATRKRILEFLSTE